MMKRTLCLMGMLVVTFGDSKVYAGPAGFTASATAAAHHGGGGPGHPGHPMRRCDPSNPNACGRHAYCRLPNGACDATDTNGVCTPIPQHCPADRDPVCGCDGATYANRCVAHQNRVSIAYPGPCGQECRRDGAEPCPDGEFCVFPPETCDDADPVGVCRMIPESCPDVVDPVCGCDGVTYGNRCEAGMAGQSIAHRGACEQVCGGIAGLPCDESEFCKLPIGSCCCDFQGVCKPIPDACPDIYDPVCGCDGVTYGNRCEAAMAGQSIDHHGECTD